jgi:methylmalonyl-CoA mutase C-terminal domain/subunit
MMAVEQETPIRIMLAKLGLDGHDRGVKVVALGLKDHGFEVIYLGLHQTPEQAARAAMEEDVDVLGVSILSGAHETLIPRLMDELRRQETPIPVVVGGFIPDDDIEPMLEMGVRRIFLGDTPITEIVTALREIVAAQAEE